jgi:hypothetical protein
MSKFLAVILRFGPLVAAFALGLAAVLEPFVPGYTGILTSVLGLLGLVGVTPDQDVTGHIGELVAGTVALVGVSRKLYSLIKAKIAPTPA